LINWPLAIVAESGQGENWRRIVDRVTIFQNSKFYLYDVKLSKKQMCERQFCADWKTSGALGRNNNLWAKNIFVRIILLMSSARRTVFSLFAAMIANVLPI